MALGHLFGKVDNGASTPPANDLAKCPTDGVQDLDLGTGVANLPAGALTFAINPPVATAPRTCS